MMAGFASRFAITPLVSSDVPAVTSLTDAVSLQGARDISDGFLISGYPAAVYHQAVDRPLLGGLPETILLVARCGDGELAGFIFGYTGVYGRQIMGGVTERMIDESCADQNGYYILKQIAIDRRWRRQGVGVGLVQEFLNRVPQACDTFVTIVTSPPNPASEGLHSALGFRPEISSLSRDGSGKTYPSRIWRRSSTAAIT
jgi:GNAT superfamily N-acetyltransferase